MFDTAILPWQRASDSVKYLAFSWELCPPEILSMIFKNLNGKALLACMTVSKRWKDVVMDYIEHFDLWEKIALEEMVNMGRTFQRRSTLNYKEMLINSKLWPSVDIAHIDLYHTHVLENIIKIHVYKDNLILLMDDNIISYFDIKKKVFRMINNSSINVWDYCENDFMAVFMEKYEEDEADLRLFGKRHPDDKSFNESFMYVMNGVILFWLEANICYMITSKHIVWALKWRYESWDLRLRGRYYGSLYDTITAMHVTNNIVSMVTKSGLLLCEDPKSQKFNKVCQAHNQVWPCSPKKCVMFNQSDVVVSVSGKNQRIQVYHDADSNRMIVHCADMTCATEHGEVLFIGFKDGTVAICIPKDMKPNQSEPRRLLQIKDFDQSVTDPAILGLDVFEDNMSHHLFVAVRHKVIQLLITYPHKIKQYYE